MSESHMDKNGHLSPSLSVLRFFTAFLLLLVIFGIPSLSHNLRFDGILLTLKLVNLLHAASFDEAVLGGIHPFALHIDFALVGLQNFDLVAFLCILKPSLKSLCPFHFPLSFPVFLGFSFPSFSAAHSSVSFKEYQRVEWRAKSSYYHASRAIEEIEWQ